MYDAHHYLVTSVHLPTVGQIIKASREQPCLGLVLRLDQREISQLMADCNLPPPRAQQSSRGMATGEATVVDAFGFCLQPPIMRCLYRKEGAFWCSAGQIDSEGGLS